MATKSNNKRTRINRLLRILAGGYIIVFLPILIFYLALQKFTPISGRMLLYALAPVTVVLLILFIIYGVRVARAGHFWTRRDTHGNIQSLHSSEK